MKSTDSALSGFSTQVSIPYGLSDACQRANSIAMSSGHLVIIPRIPAPVKRSTNQGASHFVAFAADNKPGRLAHFPMGNTPDKAMGLHLGVFIRQGRRQSIRFHQLNAIINLFGCHLQLLGQVF